MELKDLTGHVCVVTGANSGIGKATARALGEQGATVVMVCRSKERGEAARADLRAATSAGQFDLVLTDLAVQSEVRDLASTLLSDYDRLDVLVNNAGVFLGSRQETPDGIEATFAINHLAPFLLTYLTIDRLRATAEAEGEARIVTVSSDAHRGHGTDLEDINQADGYSALQAYSASKLANVLFTHELSRRLHETDVTANCVHPGVVATNIFRGSDFFSRIARLFSWFYKSPEDGAKGPIYLAASPEVEDMTGQYFSGTKRVNPSPAAYDEKAAARLWRMSVEMTGLAEPAEEEEEEL